MKGYFLFALLVYCTDVRHTIANVLSTTNNGIFLAIGAWPSESVAHFDESAPVPFDRTFLWQAYSKIGPVELNFPNPEFGIKVEMYDQNGKKVAKTYAGNKYGTKFDGVRTYGDVLSGRSMGDMEALGQYDERELRFHGAPFAPPKDLFQIEKPGMYTLEIEMQMFLILKKNPTNWDRQLLHFAPMKIKVEMPFGAKPTPVDPVEHNGALILALCTATSGIVATIWFLMRKEAKTKTRLA